MLDYAYCTECSHEFEVEVTEGVVTFDGHDATEGTPYHVNNLRGDCQGSVDLFSLPEAVREAVETILNEENAA